MSRLKDKYDNSIRAALQKEFDIKNPASLVARGAYVLAEPSRADQFFIASFLFIFFFIKVSDFILTFFPSISVSISE